MTLNADAHIRTDRFAPSAARPGRVNKKRGLRNLGFNPARSVIDWVTFIVELERNSHGGYLKATYAGIGVSYVRPLDAGAGGAARRFRFHLQHPATFGVIDALLSDLNENYGLASLAELVAMEVSIDFFHETACPMTLSAMTERLMQAITPPIITNPRVFGGCFDMTGGYLPSIRPTVSAERTLYIGNKGEDLLWRVYLKLTDETYEGEDGKRVPKSLPPAEWRVRVEVRLQGGALRDLNLLHVKDLERFTFERLHSAGLFKFTKRVPGAGPLLTNVWSQAAAKSLGNEKNWPSCVVNRFGRRDHRGRVRQISRHLTTDVELTDACRQALRGLTRRFGRPA